MKEKFPFSVYIIESPSPSDLYSNIYEGEILVKALSLLNIPAIRRLVIDLEHFKEALTSGLIEYVNNVKKVPVLHISSHGDEKGIQLTDGNRVNWVELHRLISLINKIFKGSLIICLSSCKSLGASVMAMSEKELPYYCIIGNSGDPDWKETMVGYLTFYHLMAKGSTPTDSINAMRKASGNEGFIWVTAKEAQDIYIKKIRKLEIERLLESAKKIMKK